MARAARLKASTVVPLQAAIISEVVVEHLLANAKIRAGKA